MRRQAVRTPRDGAPPAKKSTFTIADDYLAGLDEKTQLALAESRAPYTLAIRTSNRFT